MVVGDSPRNLVHLHEVMTSHRLPVLPEVPGKSEGTRATGKAHVCFSLSCDL